MATVANPEKVDFYSLDPVTQRCLCRATWRFISRAMADPELWARVQAKTEEMYADGRLRREG